jgi:hypothetical protein
MNYSKFRVLVLTTMLFAGFALGNVSAQSDLVAASIPVKGGLSGLNVVSTQTAVINLRNAFDNLVPGTTVQDREIAAVRGRYYSIVADAIEQGSDIESAIVGNRDVVDYRFSQMSGVPAGTADAIVLEVVTFVTQ